MADLQSATSSKHNDLWCFYITISTGGLNHLPYPLSISLSMPVIKDLSTNYMKALGLNQAYILLKLRNNY